MPFLNWRQKELGQEMSEHQERLTLALAPELRAALAAALDELFGGDGANGEKAEFANAAAAELRVDLPRGWILFWKPREHESRLLLSHPSQDEFVATLALAPAHARRFAARLAALGSGEEAAVVAEAGETPVAGMSNVEVAIRAE